MCRSEQWFLGSTETRNDLCRNFRLKSRLSAKTQRVFSSGKHEYPCGASWSGERRNRLGHFQPEVTVLRISPLALSAQMIKHKASRIEIADSKRTVPKNQ